MFSVTSSPGMGLVGLVGILILGAALAVGQKAPPQLPKTVGLTEIQKLKDENLQLKIRMTQDELNNLNNQRVELLKGALAGNGVQGKDIEKYNYDQTTFVFTLKEEPKAESKKPTESK